MEELTAGISQFLGLGLPESKEVAKYCETLDSKQLSSYLESLLPASSASRKFIQRIVSSKDKESTVQEKPAQKASIQIQPLDGATAIAKTKTRPAKKKDKPKTKNKQVFFPAGKSKKASTDYSQPVGRDSSKLITGNESDLPSSVTNCLSCGMIYESRHFERLSLCEFCNSPLSRKGRKGTTLEEKEEYIKAEALKNKLLQFDASAIERTKILDDQANYNQSILSSTWATESEKEKAAYAIQDREKELADLNRMVHISLDISNRKIVEAKPNLPKQADEVYKELQKLS
mmetsp:Transcript_3756/g.5029  ORF Transcript_3756/g.5029 Transcript_3756/m.5029 type:complete len:288 (-) Transcript_3756:1500-2363(-)